MADHADDDDYYDGNIFVYRGGRAPQHVTHVRIDDESVDEIEENAFQYCKRLVQVETHDGIRKIGREAFYYCTSLRRINLKSAVEIDDCGYSRLYEFVQFPLNKIYFHCRTPFFITFTSLFEVLQRLFGVPHSFAVKSSLLTGQSLLMNVVVLSS